MTIHNSKIPKRRFKEFENADAWEQRKLGDVADITMGQSPNSENYTNNPDDYILVQGNADMKNGQVFPRIWTTQVTKIAKKYDLILSVRAPVGDIGKTDYDVVLGRGVAAIKGNEFLFQLLGKMKKTGYWTKLSTGSTFESINSNEIKEASILIPSDEEQKKIGLFFNNLDHLITLHQRKLDKIKALKQAYFSEMFPAEGERVPKRRFTGFTDTWEQYKLGDLTQIKTGSSDLQDAVEDGEYPFFVRSENIERSSRYIFDGEAILIPGEGRLGEIYHYINGKFDFHQRVYKISNFADSDTDGKYVLYYMQKNFKQHAMKFTVKATVNSLRLPMLTDFSLVAPKVEEQRKISAFFSNLDTLITLHQQKLEKLQNLKQAYLNEIFI
ncbi:type I restriction enzyme S protein [Weissella oryzae SG25]|uniref:Type I restriction enzyme S protein n=1 Tax=Weissella oryzae (strain DSM 25784 / JCM 18191 / LMG 30913 / SG25) TaxID=1329250 RepID=A0A069CXX9_WEIOS|nr:restriction endonuclease subunit S [Weissella oryzae]GAK29926.1 type I restriction enzyme S protein [Weissella oryzae SG25]